MGVKFYKVDLVAQSHRIYPYFKNKKFSNYPGEKQEGILKSIYLLVESIIKRQPCTKQFKRDWMCKKLLLQKATRRDGAQPSVTWIGHATFIIQAAGLTIATDPIFGRPSFLFPRIVDPGVPVECIPDIDIILISHNHHDHMHAPTLRAILKKNPNVQLLVPLGDKKWFDCNSFGNVQEYTWWDSVQVTGVKNQKITCSFLPAFHWSGRGIFDRNKSLWGSWMIQSAEHTLYFAGDTAYGKHFRAIAQEFPHIDMALMPIGPCEPHSEMVRTHVTPEQAGKAFLDLNARQFVPMHWGVYHLGTDAPLTAIERLQQWWETHTDDLKHKQLQMLKFGETCECEHLPQPVEQQIPVIDRPSTQKEL